MRKRSTFVYFDVSNRRVAVFLKETARRVVCVCVCVCLYQRRAISIE